MHAVFSLYGIKTAVDHLIMDMQSQKFQLPLKKEGEEDKFIWMQGHLRILPFGIYEYIFPRESMDLVLTTMNFNSEFKREDYDINKEFSILGMKIKPFEYFKKFLGVKEIPVFKNDKKLVWMRDNVSFIPIGIREDKDLVEPEGEWKGWTHEAI